MKVVFFLGAGLSAAWGLPVMKSFFRYVRDLDYLRQEDKDFLAELCKKTRRAAAYFNTTYNNLGDILSFCFATENFTGNYPIDASDDYRRFCSILYEIYRHVGHNQKYWDLSFDKCMKLFRTEQNEHEITIITTNYDVVTEFALFKLGRTCQLPCEWIPIQEEQPPRRDSLYTKDKNAPLLCKLHGSVNWFSPSDNKNKIQVENNISSGTVFVDEDDGSVKPRRVWFPRIGAEKYSSAEVPLIIPPTFFKLQPTQSFQQIWQTAGQALRNAERLVFVGYSFPDSDTYFPYFLAESLSENDRLGDDIIIIDPKAEEIKNRLKNQGKLGRHFMERLRCFKQEWQTNPDIAWHGLNI